MYTRSLHPRVAAGLAPLVNLQLRAVKTTDLERRLAKVEKLLARAEAEDDLKGDGDTRGRDFGKAALAKILRGGRAIGHMGAEVRTGPPIPWPPHPTFQQRCTVEWQALHSVIRFCSESSPEWLRNSL
jgi:hypothetical protein